MLSLGVGVGVTYYLEIVQNLHVAKSILSSKIAKGTLIVLFLNLVLPEEAMVKSAD